MLLDFLFNICFSPFYNAIKGGRIGAVFLLTPSLTFIVCGLINIIFHETIGSVTLIFNPLALGVFMLMLFILIYISLDRIYIKKNRDLRMVRYLVLYRIILLPFFLGSVVFFTYTVGKFG